jgi:hemerythrin-like metal-binding protein
VEHYVEWKPFYSVGDPTLDEEHKRLLGIIDDLYGAVHSGNQHEQVQKVLDSLTHYTMTHFDHEERIMQSCGYPRLEPHKIMHDEMRRRTLELKTTPDAVAARDLLEFVKNWWVRHIQNQDKTYAPYIEAVVRQPIGMR